MNMRRRRRTTQKFLYFIFFGRATTDHEHRTTRPVHSETKWFIYFVRFDFSSFFFSFPFRPLACFVIHNDSRLIKIVCIYCFVPFACAMRMLKMTKQKICWTILWALQHDNARTTLTPTSHLMQAPFWPQRNLPVSMRSLQISNRILLTNKIGRKTIGKEFVRSRSRQTVI